MKRVNRIEGALSLELTPQQAVFLRDALVVLEWEGVFNDLRPQIDNEFLKVGVDLIALGQGGNVSTREMSVLLNLWKEAAESLR